MEGGGGGWNCDKLFYCNMYSLSHDSLKKHARGPPQFILVYITTFGPKINCKVIFTPLEELKTIST